MSAKVESYEQAVEFLFNRVNFERLSGHQYSNSDFKLDRMRELLRLLGNPQQALPVVHIAGTKGKGSTAALTAAILTAAGIRVGLFTSPHISAFEERIAVNGACPSADELVELVRQIAEVVNELDKLPGQMSPTYFEIATALAWLFFREQRAELAVLEVGMGGRLDSTNVCCPAVSMITTISRDHTRQLGSRVEQIAREKAGIIKPSVPVVSGVADEAARNVIVETCQRLGAPLTQLGTDFQYRYQPARIGNDQMSPAMADILLPQHHWQNLRLPLVGEHQARNLALAAMAVECLREQGWNIPRDAVPAGLGRLRWPGRIEILGQNPTVIVDAAHNWEAVAALLRTLSESFQARRRVLIFAATRDKDVTGMLRQLLPRFDTIILTCFQSNPRHVPVEALAETVQGLTDRLCHRTADAASAWKLARRLAAPTDLICATGSFFLAAELRELIIDSLRTGEAELPSDSLPNRSSVGL
ncbi:MAG: bifunctional folylpolyglutamate synthase/dihydrofolate synthase [Planctomycetes bacterium]|nr:bifunctional folylpolyglutamate synthase/dihydrofolate synthase [Planctomycetota bacterium]